MNLVVVYNLECVEFIVIKTTLSQKEVVKKAIEFKGNGGIYESDFVDQLNEHGYAEILPGEAVDFNNLDIYEIE